MRWYFKWISTLVEIDRDDTCDETDVLGKTGRAQLVQQCMANEEIQLDENFGREVAHGSMGCGWAKAIRDYVQEQEDDPDGDRKGFAAEVKSDWERKWKEEEETVFADGQACGGGLCEGLREGL